MSGTIAVDFDGTLATYDHHYKAGQLGKPIPAMVERVKSWLAEGRDVVIFTARVSGGDGDDGVNRTAIEDWCRLHVGKVLPVTATKHYSFDEIWDDRAIQVESNTGRRIDGQADLTITHMQPLDGESVTQCCGAVVFDLSSAHRMTTDPELVTCRA